MKNCKYSKKEIKEILENKNVKAVKYGDRIEYSDFFKDWAVLQSIKYPYLSANQIFEMAGFNISIIGKRIAYSRLQEWKLKYYQKLSQNQKQKDNLCKDKLDNIFLKIKTLKEAIKDEK